MKDGDIKITPADREAFRREDEKVEAGMEILERACEEILKTVYCWRVGDGPGATDRRNDLLAMLTAVYCRIAKELGADPEEMFETFLPDDARTYQ